MKDKEATRQRILEVGKRAFIEKGYDGAYLRDIAKEAGVTTGAIYGHYKDKDALFTDRVSPVLEGLKERLAALDQEYLTIDNDTLRDDPMIIQSPDEIVDYVYDHLEEFLLLYNSADKTSMKNWLADFERGEEVIAQLCRRKWKEAGLWKSDIEDEFIYIIISSYYRNMFEAVAKGFDREKTKRFVKTLSIYNTGGFKAMAEQTTDKKRRIKK